MSIFSFRRTVRTLRATLHALMLAALLAGLIPPPLVTSVADWSGIEPLAELADALPQPAVALAAGTISGTTFRDFNYNGQLDGGEPGIDGVAVAVFDGSGASCPATTAGGGTYSVDTATCGSLTAGPYRVEFTLPTDGSLDFLEPAIAGATTVQFVADGGATVDAGFQDPARYAQANPRVAIAENRAGSNDNLYQPAGILSELYDEANSRNSGRTDATNVEVGAT